MNAGTDGLPTAPEPAPQTEPDAAPLDGRRARSTTRRQKAARRRANVVGIVGELLLTAGVVVLLFIGWQLWLSEYLIGHEQKNEAAQLSQEWNDEATNTPTPPPASETPTPTETPTADPTTPAPVEPLPDIALNPPVSAAPAYAADFGMLIVPRWGEDYYRKIAEGVDAAQVLDRSRLGHYDQTQLPGEVGNFALAAHRMGKGGLLHYVDELQIGDHIFVETRDGWYQYSFRNLEYVRASGIGVLNEIPQSPATPQGERYITLTSCNPEHTTTERIIAYGLFDRFYPRDTSAANNGAPDEIAATVNGA